MALKNQAITVCYVAWNTSTNGGQTGDSGNHTLKLVQDGVEGSPTNAPTQVDATNAPGLYQLALVAADMNFNCVVLCGKSSTANVVIIPIVIVTERGVLPTVAPASSGGFITLGTSTGQLTTDGAGRVDVGQWLDHAVTVDTNNAPNVSAKYWAGTAITATSIPVATAAGAAGGLFVAGTNAATTITTSLTTHLVGTVDTVTTVTNQLTAAAIATGVWTDTTAGDFTTTSSPGKILVAQLGGAFTNTSSSVYSTASLANAPTGGSAPTVSQIASAVWQDTTAGDFTVAGSIGKSLFTSGNAPGASGGYQINGTNAGTVTYAAMTITGAFTWTGGAIGSITGNLSGSVASVASAVTVTMSQLLGAPRALDAVADGSMQLNDAMWCAVASAAGKWTVVDTTYTVETPLTGTVIRTFTLDSATAPTQRT